MATFPQIAALLRNRINAPVPERLRLQSMIKSGLEKLSDEVALDRNRKHLLLTPRATTTASISGGAADLTNLVNSSPFINLSRIKSGAVYHSSSSYPVQWVENQQAGLTDSVDDMFVNAYLEGNLIKLKNTNLTGTLSLSVPFTPTVSTLPDSLIDDLLDILVEIAREGKADE